MLVIPLPPFIGVERTSMKQPSAHIELRLFATLTRFEPSNARRYPINTGSKVGHVLAELQIPQTEAKLIFINGVKGTLETLLYGGERVGIFPPVGGG